jgi:hypothetical protein
MSNIIEVLTTSIIIHNYKQGNYQGLGKRLSVWEKTKFGGSYCTWSAFIVDEENETMTIHKGINLNELMKYFPNHTIETDISGKPCKYMKLKLTIEPRSLIQSESVNFLTNKGTFFNYNNETQKFLCLKPGVGKTYVAINYITKTGRIPIVIVDNDKILQQWKDSFKKFTDIKDEEMFVISGSRTIKKLMKQTNNPYKVYLASHRTLDSYCNNNWSLLNNLFQKIGIGDKIFDEAHVEWKNIFYIDCNTDVKNTIYLTATPSRSSYNEQEVYERMFNNIVTYGLEESRKEKYIRYIEVVWNSLPTEFQELNMSNNHGFDSNAYNEYLLKKDVYPKFKELLINLLNDLWKKNPDNKIAIVVNCNNMIQTLYDDFKDYNFINGKVSVGRFCGLVPKAKKDLELDNQLILTTLKGFGKGVDVDNLAIVINTVSISSKVLVEQLSGRLRYDPNIKKYYIQITDRGFKQCRSHSRIRNKLMEQIAKKMFLLEFDK